jgi:hypothetical protein
MPALLAGIKYDSLCQATEGNDNLTPDLDEYSFDYWPPYTNDLRYSLKNASLTRNLFTGTTWGITAGNISETYFYDFYFRIHLIPLEYNIGYILSDQTYPIYLWNAHTDETITLNGIAQSTLPDVILSTIISTPYTLKPLEEIPFVLSVPIEGLDVISGFYTFTFLSDPEIILNISGSRAILWPFAPKVDSTEIRAWDTDIIPSKESEQRFARRPKARTTYNYNFIFRTNEEYILGKKIARVGVKKNLGIPIWSDVIRVENLVTGQSIIFFDTTYSEISVNSSIVIYRSYQLYEVKTVTAITSDYIVLGQVLLHDFSVAYIAPVRLGRALNGIKMQRSEGHKDTASISLLTTDTFTSAGSGGSETFLTRPVITTIPVVSGGLEDKYARKLEVVDQTQGNIFYYNVENYVRVGKNIRFVTHSQEELFSLRRFFDYAQGKLQSFWIPSFHDDLRPYDINLPTSYNQIRVYSGKWVSYGVENIRVIGDRTVNLQITNAVDNLDGTETLTFTPALSQSLNNIQKIHTLTLMRFDSDNIEFQFEKGKVTFVDVPLIEVRA